MRKLLLTTAAVAAISSANAFAAETDFYVKANAGVSKLSSHVQVSTKKFKNDSYGIATIGAGYYINEDVRTDLTLDYLLLNEKNKEAKINGRANTLLANVYADVYSNDLAKFFVGAGAGAYTMDLKAKGITTKKHKAKTAFVYALHAGVSTIVAEGINAELAYSFKDFGHVKFKNNTMTKTKIKTHSITAGIRFDI
ncbi:MAG: hypothetical protein DGJ47_000622 [Rickettsiaceae bacterium]